MSPGDSMPIATIDWVKGKVKLIDQTRLPEELVYLSLDKVEDVWEAIKHLRVRGAPALAIAGSLGVVMGIKDSKARSFASFYKELKKVTNYLAGSRPTAVNLFWALKRMERVALANKGTTIPLLKEILLNEARAIIEEDKKICRHIGKNGAKLIKDEDTILTHCNAGGLATADYGTALACLFRAREEGRRIKVYVDETRPLLQGARLTTWELKQAGIEVILICDNMAGEVMKEGKIDKVIVGADRIARNGDTANKIGTYSLAVLASHHHIPFYVAAPISTFDLSLANGRQIPIEERKAEEITLWFGKRVAPKGVKVYNPAFDVTPARFITAIITEAGIARPPYEKSLRRIIQNYKNSI